MALRIAQPAQQAYHFPLLVRHLLHTPLATAPEQTIVSGEIRLTYRQIERRIHRLADALRRMGVQQGTTVAVMDWDSHRYLECFFAVPMMGAVLQTVNVRLAPEQIEWTLRHAQAQVLLVHSDFLPILEAMRPNLPSLRTVVLLQDHPKSANVSHRIDSEYEEALAQANDQFPFEDFDENAVATTFYTTGTTGLPKGVCFSHRQLVLHTLAVMGAIGTPGSQRFHHDDVYMPMTPMFHVHGWGFPYVATVMGVKQVYPGRYEPMKLLSLREHEGVTYSHCVPTILRMLLSSADETGSDLSGWKITIGGSALPAQLARDALARGIEVFAAYGMSETGPVLTITRVPEGMTTRGDEADIALRCRTGLPIPLVDLRIVDPDMNDVPHDGRTPGEIVVRAPWLTPCYVGDEAASARLWDGEYLHTQDVATIDPDGYVQIRDRLKDVIKTGGEWISSLVLEDILSRHEAVLEAAVIGVPDDKWGERPLAFIVTRPSADTPTAESLRAHFEGYVAAGQIPNYAVPSKFVVVDALDKTSVGKVDKKRLRLRAAGEAQT